VEKPGMDELKTEIPKYSGVFLETTNCPSYSTCGITKEEQYRTCTKLTAKYRGIAPSPTPCKP